MLTNLAHPFRETRGRYRGSGAARPLFLPLLKRPDHGQYPGVSLGATPQELTPRPDVESFDRDCNEPWQRVGDLRAESQAPSHRRRNHAADGTPAFDRGATFRAEP